jgi:ABC-type dipeptide/oligopeptide/nickel transport system permease subunit
MSRLADALQPILKRRNGDAPDAAIREGRFRWRLITLNLPFIAGLLIVLFLLVIALTGPRFASENPYLSAARSSEMINGELVTPPFAPSGEFPLGSDQWGRDILSLLLYGARNTLVACLFVTMARLLLGFGLGAVAGWRAGGLLDRIIMGAVEILSSLPMLLVGMILIYALDIRKGLLAFLIALCLVGWGEIAQYIRSEFVTLREKPFVEGARIIGLTETGIVIRHILPNVLPALVVLTLLEMGAVLMILGELGFVGVFIGGGTQTEGFDGNISIADIPEWGAMLAGARTYVRNSPWMVFWPAMAFFVSVLGFNLMGEGLRRIIREAGVNTAALISKRMVVAVAAITLLTWYIVSQISPGVSYAKLAGQFDADLAAQHAAQIVELQRDDPGFGTDGALAAAEYIAGQLEASGVLPAAGTQTFLQPVARLVAPRLSAPVLEVAPEGGGALVALAHGADFGEQVYRHGGSGAANGPLTFVGFATQTTKYADFRGLDLRGQVALVLAENMPAEFDNEALIRGAGAILIISDDAAPRTDWLPGESGFMQKPTFPILHVRPDAADRLLSAAGSSVADLRAAVQEYKDSGAERLWFAKPLGLKAAARVEFGEPVEKTGYNVLGILPGNDTALDEQALVVSTHYDMPQPDPGQAFLSASDGPAGVGLLLEIARQWNAEEFKPRRTVLFNIWAGGYSTASGVQTYFADYTPYRSLQRNAVIHLAGVGSGGETIVLEGDNAGALSLLQRSSQVSEISAATGSACAHAYCAELSEGSVALAWEDAPDAFRGSSDDLDADRLSQIGQIVNLALITASRQYHY